MQLSPGTFTGLVRRHPQGVGKALALEAEASRFFEPDFTQRQLCDFIRRVCEWGNYPGTADRILQENQPQEIRRRFNRAVEMLRPEEPVLKGALREIARVRHIGLSFASKHLRLLRPDVCPILDHLLSDKLGYPLRVYGYQQFAWHCRQAAALLQEHGVENPAGREGGAWFAADVEMGLFVHVKEQMGR